MNKRIILVLGAEGMLGRIVFRFLQLSKDNICFGTSKNAHNNILLFDALKLNRDWRKLLNNTGKVDYVVNCIALLKSYPDRRKIAKRDYIKINTDLPLFLEKRSYIDKFKLIHFSTDSVFPKSGGVFHEGSAPNPKDNYDKSKLSGEVTGNNSLTVRSSIIGYDPINKKGLIEYLLNTKSSIEGYVNHKWSGATVLQIAKFINWLTAKKGYNILINKTHIIHFVPLGPITKYDLFKKICDVNGLKVVLSNKLSKTSVSRYLKSNYSYLLPKYLIDNNIAHALKELKSFEKNRI